MSHPPVNVVTIHHFDDEPNNVSALRDNLLYQVLARKPDWIRPEEIPEDDGFDQPFVVNIHHPTHPVKVTYRFYVSSDDFCAKADLKKEDIALIDAYERKSDGPADLTSKRCAEKAKDKLSLDRIFLLSAYCKEIPVELKDLILVDRFIVKPFNVNTMTDRLLAMMGIHDLDT